MSKNYYVYKYKVNNCTPNTKRNFYKTLGLCCDLYNAALELKQCAYRAGQLYRTHNNKWLDTKTMMMEGYDPLYVDSLNKHIVDSKMTYYSGITLSSGGKYINGLSYQIKTLRNEDSRYKEVNSNMLHSVLQRLETTYDNFLSGRAKYPRFKSKRFYDSLEFKQSGFKLVGKNLYISGIGNFSLFLDRPVEGIIKRVILKRDRCNDIFVSFVCESDDRSKRILSREVNEIGIDPGLDSLLTFSNGTKIPRLKLFDKYYNKLSYLDRQLSKKRKLKSRGEYPSKRYEKQLIIRNKLWRKIVDIRTHEYHKIAREIVSHNNVIVLGKSNIKGMMNKSLRNGKSFSDAAIFQFKTILEKLCKSNNRQFVYVDEKHTTQKCFNCGNIKQNDDKMILSDRIYSCNVCGYIEDRDVNAAKNILEKGKLEIGLTTGTSSVKLKAALV